MNTKSDTLFSAPVKSTPFQFDKSVAEVFPDMIKRSVPGYDIIIKQIEKLAGQFVKNNTNCFDLGCSLGAASLAMSKGIHQDDCKIIAVDNSEAMLGRCQQHINAFKHSTPVELHLADILDMPVENAAMVVLNFTLQFIQNEKRSALLSRIYEGMNSGGVLLLSEKIIFKNPTINRLLTNLHHDFKKENGYSDLEISQKRNALENVLTPETLDNHLTRLNRVGFSTATCWLQQFNFISIIAIK